MGARKKSWIRWTLGVGVVVGGLAAWTWTDNDRVGREMELALRAGLSFDPRDFYRDPVPAAQNAAGHYQFANQEYRGLTPDERSSLHDYSKPNPALRAATMRRLQPAFAAIRKGASKPFCDYQPVWERGRYGFYDVRMQVLDTFVRNLGERAHGDFPGAMDDLRVLRRMAGQYAEARMFEQERAAEQTFLNAAGKLALAEQKNPGHLSEVRKLLMEPLPKIDYREMLRVEAFYSWVELQGDRARPLDLTSGSMNSLRVGPIYNHHAASLLKSHREIIERMGSRGDLDSLLAALTEARAAEPEISRTDRYLGSRWEASFGRRRHMRSENLRRSLIIMTHLLDHRRVHGEFPAKLGNVGEIGIQPFTKVAYRYYRITKDEFSINGSLQDDEHDEMDFRFYRFDSYTKKAIPETFTSSRY